MSNRSLSQKQLEAIHVCVDLLVKMSEGDIPHLMTMVDLVAGMIMTTASMDDEEAFYAAVEMHADHIRLYANTYRGIKEANSGRA